MENASPKYNLMFIIFIYSEETQTSGTDLEEINTEDELANDTSNWSKNIRNYNI